MILSTDSMGVAEQARLKVSARHMRSPSGLHSSVSYRVLVQSQLFSSFQRRYVLVAQVKCPK